MLRVNNSKCKIFRRYVYMNLNIQRKVFKSVFEINTYSNENECFHVFLLAIYDKDLLADLVLKNKNTISHFHKKQVIKNLYTLK